MSLYISFEWSLPVTHIAFYFYIGCPNHGGEAGLYILDH